MIKFGPSRKFPSLVSMIIKDYLVCTSAHLKSFLHMAVQDLSKISSRQPFLCLKAHGVTVLEVDWLVLAVSGFYRVLPKLKSRESYICKCFLVL